MKFEKKYISQIKLISKDSEFFPKNLLVLPDCPDILFILGNEKLLNTHSVSIVGTRNSSNLGNEIAFNLSQNISINNITIVSGMAKGIDTKAHQGTFNKGKTIAIVACGFNYLLNSSNIKLVTEIIQNNGVIVSEYFPDTSPQAFTFLKRNRLIATISNATIVVEAPLKSGALNTAQIALAHNKPVFAIPWSLNIIRGEGCNFLIQNHVNLLTNYKQILDYLNIPQFINSIDISTDVSTTSAHSKITENSNISSEYFSLYNYIKKNQPVSKSIIYSVFSDESIANLNSKLTLMELQELITLKRW